MNSNVLQFNRDTNTRDMMAEAKFFEGYSRWDDDKSRYESWHEAVDRVMDMHRETYADKMNDELEEAIQKVHKFYDEKYMLGAQRVLQFGGEPIKKHNTRLYNCAATYADRPEYFGEFFYVLLAGAGVGTNISKEHTNKIPKIKARMKQAKIHEVEDSIEGWSTAVDVLMSSYFVGGGKHPEYEGRRVYFDLSKIRTKGSFISGGFKAPGPEPLRQALDKIEHKLQGIVLKNTSEYQMKPIEVYDIAMYIADACISGGVRRSATVFMFDIDDEEMASAKTGNWYIDNPQRARSNNSAIVIKGKTSREEFNKLFQKTKEFGEPGFIFSPNNNVVYNPCVEVGMVPQTEDGRSGFQFCNLCEINGAKMETEEVFYATCEAAAIMGTLQAGYTNFPFLSKATKEIVEREALLGVSITGWMNNPTILFDEEILKRGSEIVLETNERIAKLIGINPAARATTTKPSGNSSVLLETASGIHGEHAPRYLRNIQMNKDSEVAQVIKERNPYMVEESLWSATNSDYVISFPIISPQNSIWKSDLYGVNLLEKVKLVQQAWIEGGTRVELGTDPEVRHNVSNTVSVLPNQWDEVRDYLFDNQKYFAGVSLLSATGDYDYVQAPNTTVYTEDEIIQKFGRGAMFASGLIVSASKGFSNLWEACMIAKMDEDKGDQEVVDLRAEWIRRFKNYANNYFDGDLTRAEYCLKAVHLLHKWVKIQQNFDKIDFGSELKEKVYTDADTLAAAACQGGSCEI